VLTLLFTRHCKQSVYDKYGPDMLERAQHQASDGILTQALVNMAVFYVSAGVITFLMTLGHGSPLARKYVVGSLRRNMGVCGVFTAGAVQVGVHWLALGAGSRCCHQVLGLEPSSESIPLLHSL